MLVRCVNNDKGNGYKHDLTVGKVYAVLGMNFADLTKHKKIIIQAESDGYPCGFDFSLFEMDDLRIPDNWCLGQLDSRYYGEESFYLGPKEFSDYKGFWEKFHEDDEEAMRIFLQVLKKIWTFHGLEAQ